MLPPQSAKALCHHFGIDELGNALADPQGEFRGKNILFSPFTIKQSADFLSMTESEMENIIENGKRMLFEARSKRPRPYRDDKIITAWNGLMISAFARASNVLKEKRYAEAARRAAIFIKENLYDVGARTLWRRYRDGEARHEAQLDDYAFLIQGMIDLYEASFDIEWLKFSLELQGTQDALFWDSSGGGFFDCSGKNKTVLLRTKEAYDGAEPSGNSIAASNLLRLSEMAGDEIMKKNVEATLRCFSSALQQVPQAMPQMVAAIEFFLDMPRQIVIADNGRSPCAKEFLNEIARRFLPHTIRLCADSGAGQQFLAERLPFLSSMTPKDGRTTAYLCENYVCTLPVNELGQLTALLERSDLPSASQLG
jgi:uncharacterized protein YyaL (SSP411 family)